MWFPNYLNTRQCATARRHIQYTPHQSRERSLFSTSSAISSISRPICQIDTPHIHTWQTVRKVRIQYIPQTPPPIRPLVIICKQVEQSRCTAHAPQFHHLHSTTPHTALPKTPKITYSRAFRVRLAFANRHTCQRSRANATHACHPLSACLIYGAICMCRLYVQSEHGVRVPFLVLSSRNACATPPRALDQLRREMLSTSGCP